MFKKTALFLAENEKAATAIASLVQSIAIVVAGVWLGWVFYYSEIIKPSLSETFLTPKIELVKVGFETDVNGVSYVVMSLNIEMQNSSGQKLYIPSSFFVVSADKYSAGSGVFNAEIIQKSVNSYRGASSRYKGTVLLSEIVYVGNEYSGWELAVGEKVQHSRLFRVPVDRYDQIDANWYVVSGTGLQGVKISQVVVPDDIYEYNVESCICAGNCPDISDIKKPVSHSGYCPSPWRAMGSSAGINMIGDQEKTGKFTATSYFLMPAK